jgi:hypothetical protein
VLVVDIIDVEVICVVAGIVIGIVVVITVIIVLEDEWQHLAVHLGEGILVHVERVGDDVVGVIHPRVVVGTTRGDRIKMGLQSRDETVQCGTRISGHVLTVQPIGHNGEARHATAHREQVMRKPSTQVQYEYRVLHIDRNVSVHDARRLLTDEAEYGRWELARTRMYVGGRRTVWLRRKIIHVEPTYGG